VAAEKRSEELVGQLSGRLAAKDAELYSVRKELEDKILKVGPLLNEKSKEARS
jgi:hypothetical protein